MKIFYSGLAFCVLLVFGNAATVDSKLNFEHDIKPFLKEYCIRCHGPEKQKADRRVDELLPDFESRDQAMLWQEVLDQLNLGEMPPKKPYPEEKHLSDVIGWITSNLTIAKKKLFANATGTPMRRLSHEAYSNSLRDLFDFKEPTFLLAHGLPEDKIDHAFNNNANKLLYSSFLYESYLEVADKVLDRVLLEKHAPKPQRWELSAENMLGGRDVPVYHQNEHGKSYADLIGSERLTSRCWVENGFSAPIGGRYKLKIKAESMFLNNPEWEAFKTPKPGEPFELGVYATSREYGQISATNFSDYVLANPKIDEGIKIYEVDAYLQKGYVPFFIWNNGMNTSFSGQISSYASKKFKEPNEAYLRYGRWKAAELFYQNGSRIRLHGLEIEGPFYDSWPPPQTASFFPEGVPEKMGVEAYRTFMANFAKKAWRRQPKAGELDSILQLGEKTLKDASPKEALKVGMKAVLVSPGFLTIPQNNGMLDAYSLASRLSYFLWNSKPNEALIHLADTDELLDSQKYLHQIEAMLDDDKTSIFIKSFVHQWLNFDRISVMQPDKNKYKDFYNKGVHRYYTEEAKAFMMHLLHNNLSIYNCLNSDFVVVNQTLANHYGLKGVHGNDFKAVSLPKDSIRGGLITQAAVMAATSNGVDSSPVTRGIWVLENILGNPPPPPPKDVDPLDPDIRGAQTLVEQLKAHRNHSACNECHMKIDPIGMPLEVFNPIGLFREVYEGTKNSPVISKAELHNGRVIDGIQQYKDYLMDNKDKFAYCITEKMLEYATGRKMSYLERDSINEIINGMDEKFGFRDLIIAVLTSPIFKHR